MNSIKNQHFDALVRFHICIEINNKLFHCERSKDMTI